MEGTSGNSSSSFHTEFEKLYGESVNKLRQGRCVQGTVVEIGKDFIEVDIGYKSNGLVPIEQFKTAMGELKVNLGDEMEVMIMTAENEMGQVVLSKEKADQYRVWKLVEDTYEKNELVSGTVIQKVKGGLQVDIGIPAFLPGSQIDIRPQRNLDKYIGQVLDFKVLKISRDKGNIVLSRKSVLTSERDALRSETLKVLSEGVVLEGIVKNITDYGAFIDLGGIDGLLHITDISWGRINHPSEKLTIGQKIPVVVLKHDADNQRVSLGMKQLAQDPWATVPEKYPVGKKVSGKVINIADYGAFVALEEGLDGLVHVSDMTWSKKSKHPSKILSVGQAVEAVVLVVDTEEKKISLGLKQLTNNPWVEFAAKNPVGTRIKGQVRSITDFGIFVGVADDIDGLVHVSDFSWTKRIKDPKEIKELYKKGEEVEAQVLEIDVDNERLSLGVKHLTQDPWDAISKRYPVGSKVKGNITSVTDFGVFVQIEEGVEGLVHMSQLVIERGVDPRTIYTVGNEMEAEVSNIDNEERRISLSMRAVARRKEKEELSGYMEDSASPVTFGDLIRQKMGQDN
ncbi:MAG: 30S ribosomal protein S1 [bacterium]|nr:30S ribosomal protein S1 [bacterium]